MEDVLLGGCERIVRREKLARRRTSGVHPAKHEKCGGFKSHPRALSAPLPVSKADFLSQPQRSLLRSSKLNLRVVLTAHFPGIANPSNTLRKTNIHGSINRTRSRCTIEAGFGPSRKLSPQMASIVDVRHDESFKFRALLVFRPQLPHLRL